MLYIVFAILLMSGLICLAFWWMNRDNPGFDERQSETRRKAYQMGFFIEETYMLCLFIYVTVVGDPPVDWPVLIMLGVWLPAIPVVTCMIWKDAYLTSGQSHLGFGILGFLIGILYLSMFIRQLPNLSLTGPGSKLWTPLLVGIFWLWVGILMVLKHFLNKREEKAE